ncbi:MAG: hypothetical protein IKG00_09545 [Lachnospiraceae bacterium]|nr:hypothetical protein [Solobacterium sp.]MBR3310118.1 hypothetical protein [Lachnospiraceae bacterium]
MEYAAFVLSVFGLAAYLQLSSLRKRIDVLERQLTSLSGTSLHTERMDLLKEAKSRIGRKVIFTMKEERADPDIVLYGNTAYGSNTILDADQDWLLVQIETPKGKKEKLIRMEAIAAMKELTEE